MKARAYNIGKHKQEPYESVISKKKIKEEKGSSPGPGKRMQWFWSIARRLGTHKIFVGAYSMEG